MVFQYVCSATSWGELMYLGNQGVCLEQKGQRLANTTLGIDKIREPCRSWKSTDQQRRERQP